MIIEPVIITALGLDITPAIQVLLALLLGVLLGTERTLAHKNAGLRVFGLVAMGSALFTVRSELITSIKKAFDEAGIEIPFPHRTLYISK